MYLLFQDQKLEVLCCYHVALLVVKIYDWPNFKVTY